MYALGLPGDHSASYVLALTATGGWGTAGWLAGLKMPAADEDRLIIIILPCTTI